MPKTIAQCREHYHGQLCKNVIRIRVGDNESPNFADGNSSGSRSIAWGIVERLGTPLMSGAVTGQRAGAIFERLTRLYLQESFALLQHVRPGKWSYRVGADISAFAQYQHLADLARLVKESPELASALGGDYLVKPDIVIGRTPLADSEINAQGLIIRPDSGLGRRTPLRAGNSDEPCEILHASVSCKWTIRSDRSQNSRTEGLNLIRNRKGNLPHIVAVTAEPLPMRIASLALGTGDLDCIYHFALPELIEAVEELGSESQSESLATLLKGDRLRDVSDLPFDLAV